MDRRSIACSILLVCAGAAAAVEPDSTDAVEDGMVVCASKAGERQSCPADTSAGVTLVESMGPGGCELGRT
jgi:hypothetical protein